MIDGSRSSPDDGSGELRLPRPPGVIRRFWARHPRLADVLVALLTGLVTFPAPSRSDAFTGALWELTRPASVIALVVACIALVWRRRVPRLAFALAGTGVILAIPSGSGVGGATIAVAAYAVAVYAGSSDAWLAAAALTGTALLGSAAAALAGILSWSPALNGCAALVIAVLIGTLVGVNVGNRARYLAALMDTSRRLWAEREQQARLAAAAERTRIAREMHDVVSHSLTVIVALSEGATATSDIVRGRAATQQISATARGALDEMRAMLGVLRDERLDADAPLTPLDGDTVRSAVAAARSAGVPVVLRTTGGEIDDLHVRLAVARVVQEGLTNVIRHARGAREVIVTVTAMAEGVTVEIVNDGVTRSASGSGYGIRGLHERAARVGGVAEAGPLADGRWRVRLHVPRSSITDRTGP